MTNLSDEYYWTNRYKDRSTGWDIGHISPPLKAYFDQLKHKDYKILIPGAGNAYEAEYLFKNGFKHVYVLDISDVPLTAFKSRNPDFPNEQLINGDFFKLKGTYDIVIEQTFFCSFPPNKLNREAYAKQMSSLLNVGSKLVGLWFDIPLIEDIEKRPFGGDKNLYQRYLEPYFNTIVFETCYNSIPPRQGKELFGIFEKH